MQKVYNTPLSIVEDEVEQKENEIKEKENSDFVQKQEYDFSKDLDVSTWKTYESKKVGMRIKYPESWKVVELEDVKAGFTLRSPAYVPIQAGIQIFYEGEFYINDYSNPKQLSIENLFKTFDDGSDLIFSQYKYENVVINGRKGIYFSNINNKEEDYNISGNKRIFSFDYVYQKNEKIAEVSQILKKIVENFEPLE